ncbi:MAG: endonuclease domain-containing protein [Deltaproteobacteria bacterium]|nr:endonuclease domain-containing protein [Deltaproteobacteria bacterium]MBI2501351.1 endonuclease domain-containing protein [Deltaproteobacteria bacterium]
MRDRIVFNNPILKDRRRQLRQDQTDAERLLWRLIRNKNLKGLKFWRQYSVGPYILDFYCPSQRLAVELDGGQHAEQFIIEYDQERTDFLKSRSIRVLRFWNSEFLTNPEGVLEKILESLDIPLSRLS